MRRRRAQYADAKRWSRTSLKPGEQATIYGYWPRTAPRPAISARSPFLTDGTCLPDRRRPMRRRRRRNRNVMNRLAAATLTAMLAATGPPPCPGGQQGYTPPAGPSPRTASGKVDFSGVWENRTSPTCRRMAKGKRGRRNCRSPRGAKPSGKATTPQTATTPARVCPSA